MKYFLLILFAFLAAQDAAAQRTNSAETQNQLARAVQLGDVALVRALLADGVDVEVPKVAFSMPLTLTSLALARGHRAVALALLDAGADPMRLPDPNSSQHPLNTAVALLKDVALVRAFLEAGADPDASSPGIPWSPRQFAQRVSEQASASVTDRAMFVVILRAMDDEVRSGSVQAGAERQRQARMRAFATQVRVVYDMEPTGFAAIRGDPLAPKLLKALALIDHPVGEATDAVNRTPRILTNGRPLYTVGLAEGSQAEMFALARQAAAVIQSLIPGLTLSESEPYNVSLDECRDPDGYLRRGRSIALGTMTPGAKGANILDIMISGKSTPCGAPAAAVAQPAPTPSKPVSAVAPDTIANSRPPIPATGTGCLVGDCKNGYGAIRTADARTYEGDWLNGQKHGRGVFTWPNNHRYEGSWRDGRQGGEGRFTWNGHRYEGNWHEGKRHGQGKLTYADGRVFTGVMADDEPTVGQITPVAGPAYGVRAENKQFVRYAPPRASGGPRPPVPATGTGCLVGDCQNGYGATRDAQGNTYAGDFQNGKRSGVGVWTSVVGIRYEGGFREGRYDGYGAYIGLGGDRYEGEYSDGPMHGKGTLTYSDGRAPDGRIFTGTLVGGSPIHGRFQPSSGPAYEAYLKNGSLVPAR